MMKSVHAATRWLIHRYRFKKKADIYWSIFGLSMGAASAYFPWHVYLHQDEFMPPEMVFSKDRDGGFRETPQSIGIGRSGIATAKVGGEIILSGAVDTIATGTIPQASETVVAPPEFQSADRKILAVYSSGMLLKGPDSIDFVSYDGWVPGSGKIEKIERDGSNLTAVTTSGERISLSAGRRSQAPDK